eukprot:CAMPEP_0184866796 /NCGR_PEP_ID=MMETSP0580-20130426/23773_1 /TAXON_ID=1118495 /ORGANISM="Dactyliosolen fragilissimus" /LENGTH=626 /DNA_ID=CAMNT_0027366671 /DNA_START=38 /DNA_END=1918 /DNA_ORIENTATION=-
METVCSKPEKKSSNVQSTITCPFERPVKKKRGLKPRSKRKLQKAKGGGLGLGLYHDRNKDEHIDDDIQRRSYVEILPLKLPPSTMLSSFSSPSSKNESRTSLLSSPHETENLNHDLCESITSRTTMKRIRVVRPYPFTFATFAKARWVNKRLIDVYHEEFGSYPRCYYENSIKEGRIRVSGKIVKCEYIIKGGDELSHTVHRHEPAVGISDRTKGCSIDQGIINIIHENENVLVVDKPATVPVHPCGGYNFNSLSCILAHDRPDLSGNLHNVHRLDRLTSGLTILAKNTHIAKKLSKCITDRSCCKVYLARVQGKFPLYAPIEYQYSVDSNISAYNSCSPPYECGEATGEFPLQNVVSSNTNATKAIEEVGKNHLAGPCFWITNGEGMIQHKKLGDMFKSKFDIKHLNGDGTVSSEGINALWLHLACTCKIVNHKNGVCEAGCPNGKPAQTSFAIVHYDEASDSSLILVKPVTGRTHQIRLHTQFLKHPIANDSCYGGDIWYGNPLGASYCKESKRRMDEMDQLTEQSEKPKNAISTDIPASQDEVQRMSDLGKRGKEETLLSFIQRSCVWCARSKGGDRTMLEYFVRSQGIWLHAFQYSLSNNADIKMSHRTNLPSWGVFNDYHN